MPWRAWLGVLKNDQPRTRAIIVTKACSRDTSNATDLLGVSLDSDEPARHATGIALTSDAMPGSFAAFGITSHRTSGAKFFSSVPFSDPAMAVSSNSVFTGIPVGPTTVLGGDSYIPELSLANFSSKATHITVQYAETLDGTPISSDVRTIAEPAGQTRSVLLENLNGDPDLTNSFRLLSDAAPGDILATLVAKTPSRLGEVELLTKDQKDPDNAGMHPWTTEGGTESTLLLFNHSSAPQTFLVHVSSGGVLWQKSYKLQSMEAKAINIGDLIANKIKDDSGKTIPPGSTSGVATWILGPRGVGKGRLLQSNATTGMARSFSCEEYTTIGGAVFNPITSLVPAGTTVDVGEVTSEIYLVPSGSCSGTYETTQMPRTGNSPIRPATIPSQPPP